eukprot:gb/GFBE01052365.1/.p1 GENE.gb/GFBE01052365.1/~~gb/GFBE01052365.1/.p1  ORF type:complete len:214 (+),score=39.00 gb/GFBE01052365.1/:1-642(+)
MVTIHGFEFLHEIMHQAYRNKNLQGDFLEAGVWRGGACVYARGFFEAYGIDRLVWVVDSFQGLPPKQHPKDAAGWDWYRYLAVGIREVKDIFRRHALLDNKVRFVKGWFQEVLPSYKSSIGPLAILRLDGDMFLSTVAVLCTLYDKLETGGYWLVDDYALGPCKKAVDAFVATHHIQDTMHMLPDGSAWFEKLGSSPVSQEWCASHLQPYDVA